jgi:hypothetical protein
MKQNNLVEALRGAELIAGRMAAVGVDFILAGPVSLWLQGLSRQVSPLYLLLISSNPMNLDLTRRALEILSHPIAWPMEYDSIVGGRILSVEIRGGYRVAAAADPIVNTPNGSTRIIVAEEAPSSAFAVVGRYPLRLARPGLELLLRGELGDGLP